MSQSWDVKTIAECAAREPYSTQIGPFGKALTPDDYTASGVPLLRGVNVNYGRFHDDDFVFISEETAARFGKFESFPGDVLLVHKGTLGRIGLMPEKRRHDRYVMGNSMLRVKCNPDVLLPEYLYYWLTSNEGQHYLFSRVSQVGVPQIQTPLATLRQAALPVPPIPVQRRITGILSAFDDKIDLNRRMNETLDAIAGALFRSWFVDFDPVRAKQEGLHLPGLDAATAALFPDSFEDSPIGSIPSGWDTATVGEVAGVNEESIGAGYPHQVVHYVDISSVSAGHLNDVTEYALDQAPSRARRLVRHGDTIWSCVRPNRRSFLFIHQPPENLIVSTGFVVLTPKAVPSSFLYAWTTTDAFVDYLTANADGSAYPAVRADHFSSASLLLPDDRVLKRFEAIVGPLRDRVAVNERESKTLAALRDALLPKLLSGEIRVDAPEPVIEEVV